MPNFDVLSQLLECSFRGISFPVDSLDLDLSHDLIQHRRMDRNGARLEDAGLRAAVYNIKAPFCNSIARGPNETWNNLYPDTKNKMIDALSDRSTGDFVHPELGLRRCKPASFKTGLDPNYRSGIVISFTLIEDTEEDDATLLTTNANIPIGSSSAISLDATIGNLNPPPDTGLSQFGFASFTDAFNQISAVFGTIDLLNKQIIGKIDGVIGCVNKLTNQFDNAVTIFGTAPDELISSLLQIQKSALVQDKELGYYITQGKTTLGYLSQKLQNSIQQLIDLNSSLIRYPTVPSQTIVRYYK